MKIKNLKIMRFFGGKIRLCLKGLIVLGISTLYLSQPIQAQSKRLDDYLTTALKNSPLLNDYQNQLVASRIDSLEARANMGIQVTGSSLDSYAPVIGGWGYDKAITNGANLYAGVTVTKDIIGKGNQKNRYQQLDLLKKKVGNAAKISEKELKKSVTSQYLIAYGELKEYQFNGEMLAMMDKEEKVLKEITDKGIYKETDYLNFRIGISQLVFTQQQSLKQYRADVSTLNYLCGIGDTSFVVLMAPELKADSLPPFGHTVFNEQFVIDSLLLKNNQEKIDYQYKPKVSVFADGGYNSSLDFEAYKNFGLNAGVSVSVPIYDGGQRKMEHDRLTIDGETQQKYHEFYRVQYQQQVNSTLQQLDANNRLTNQLNLQTEYIRTLLETYHKLLEKGEVSITDYLIALSNYMNVTHQIAMNHLEQYQLINELNYWNQSK